MNYYLRKSSNIGQLFFLDREIFPEDCTLEFQNNENWIIFFNKIPVGFCSLKILNSENYGFFSRAGLVEGHKGRGLHKRLVQVRLDYCRKNNLGGVITYVKRDNTASANSLVSKGFRLYLPQNEWADDDCIYLRKDF